MDSTTQEIRIVPPKFVAQAAAAALLALALWGLVQVFSSIKEYRYIGSGTTATNTIVVSGEGEVFAVPDLATFSVTVEEEAKVVKDAQKVATKKTNDIIAYLRTAGIEEKDVKTTSYNVSPQYDWIQGPCDSRGYCPGGKQQLRGYSVSQTLEVKVRDTEKAGDVLSGVGTLGASNVSGLAFTIDEEDTLKAQARAEAIEDAEAKAEKLAEQLGVQLVRIVGFSESDAGYYPPVMYMKREAAVAADGMGGGAPELPTGENKIASNVTITYEIR